MGITTEARVRLDGAKFLELFNDEEDEWIRLGLLAYRFAYDIYASEDVDGSPYPDDVAKHLAPALAVNDEFLDHRNERGTRAKYWAVDFADLIVMLAWDDISVVEEADDDE